MTETETADETDEVDPTDEVDGTEGGERRYAQADSPAGLIERGRGLGVLRAGEDPAAAGATVLECLRRESRWDWQVDERHGYHAHLVRQLGLPLDVLVDLLAGEETDNWRAHQVLAELALAGDARARGVLRGQVRDGARYWQDVLDTVADRWPVEWWDDLAPDARRHLAGERPEQPDGRAWSRWEGRRRAHGGGPRQVRIEPSDSRLLAVLADPGADEGERRLAVRQLVTRPGPLPELLPLMPQLIDEGRWLPYLGRAVERAGALAAGPAREWAADGRSWAARLGLGVLARHGGIGDVPLLVGELERMRAAGEWCGADDLADGLARFGPGAADGAAALRRYWTHTPHSYERAFCLRALAAIVPGGTAAELTESLWDCEERARLFAVRHAPEGSRLRGRLRELRDSPVESRQVRAAAARRLG